jgi:hypothetical protein
MLFLMMMLMLMFWMIICVVVDHAVTVFVERRTTYCQYDAADRPLSSSCELISSFCSQGADAEEHAETSYVDLDVPQPSFVFLSEENPVSIVRRISTMPRDNGGQHGASKNGLLHARIYVFDIGTS